MNACLLTLGPIMTNTFSGLPQCHSEIDKYINKQIFLLIMWIILMSEIHTHIYVWPLDGTLLLSYHKRALLKSDKMNILYKEPSNGTPLRSCKRKAAAAPGYSAQSQSDHICWICRDNTFIAYFHKFSIIWNSHESECSFLIDGDTATCA